MTIIFGQLKNKAFPPVMNESVYIARNVFVINQYKRLIYVLDNVSSLEASKGNSSARTST